MSNGSQSVALTTKEATAALAIRDALESFRQDTGRSVTALEAVTQYLYAAKLLGERPLGEAVQDYLRTIAIVRPKALSDAVSEFVATRETKAEARDGKRSILNPKYVENTSNWLREFAETFPGHNVGDISKEHVNTYVASHAKFSAKSRNDRRAILKHFLKWCVRHDYLSTSHRLFEADGLAKEALDAAAIDYYRPDEFRTLLQNSDEQMRFIIALQRLAGLRLEEALRLDWREVFGIPGHIEVSTSKSKTRQRRLVEICPSLDRWLAPYRGREGKVASQWQTLNGYVQEFMALRKASGAAARRNGLRHGFGAYHFALHANENLTAAQAGNAPPMIHAHYKGLATKAEAEKWFAVTPSQSAKNIVALPMQKM